MDWTSRTHLIIDRTQPVDTGKLSYGDLEKMRLSIAEMPTGNRQSQMLPIENQLQRAGEILQESFYTFRELVFDKIIMKEVAPPTNLLGPMVLRVHCKGSLSLDEDFVVSSPEFLPENTFDKNKVLSWGANVEALAFFWILMTKLLAGIDVGFIERDWPIKDEEYKVDCIYINRPAGRNDLPRLKHEVTIVSVGPDEEYVFDLTAAQFGHLRPVTPLGEYEKKFPPLSIGAYKQFGHR
ncbi:hypothetical protein AC578_9557 [Pseudocercospora eumusae]|uniref:Uncharacterized protein n=1 Tax=Pseudocercospora eumusae TaxID=321146 RepID=A0A139HGG0_9PEZI|nr:hypothetical protein AC578_9557 [Pseudocercospora eumusae]